MHNRTLIHGASLAVIALLGAVGTAAQAQTAPTVANQPAGTQPTSDQAQAQNVPSEPGQVSGGSENTDATGDDIVVTGFRGSLEKSIDIKRQSAVAVDSILAEDIGKFPDLNLSESIQRIPGVALSRDGGEGRSISVRGLGPQFTRVRINGMEAIATAGGSDASGGSNRGRGFDFNVFAADLFNSITVQKTAEAATEEGSLGATVDLRTARPFDYNGFKIAASAQGSYNDLAGKFSPRGALLISDVTSDGKLGGLISVAYTKRKLIETGYSTVRWTSNNAGVAPGYETVPGARCINATTFAVISPVPDACATANAALHPRFPRYDYYIQDQERIGATASIQYKPFEHTTISLDGLYADFKATREERYLEANGFSVAGNCTAASKLTNCGVADTDVVSQTITNGVQVAGTFNDVDLRVENRFDRLDTKFKQATLSIDQKIGETISIQAVAGHSQSFFNNPIQNTVTFDQYNVQGYSYDYTNRNSPVFNFGSANLASSQGWVLSQLRLRSASNKNTYDNGQLNIDWKVAEGFSIAAGASYKEYGFTATDLRRSNGTTASQDTNLTCCTLPGDTLDKFGHIVTIEGRSFFAPDYQAANSYFGLESPTARNGAFQLGILPGLAGNVQVIEHDKSAYSQVNFTKDLGSVNIRGNAGVRYVETFQRSSGYSFASGAAVPLTVGRKYGDWLPSMNIVVEPVKDFLLRGAIAKTIARPDLVSLAPSATVSVSGANRSVSVGNPNLQPFRATTYDLSAEWYYQPGALLSVAAFQKDISTFVTTTQSSGAFSSNPFGLPDNLAIAACGNLYPTTCNPAQTNWTFSAPANTPGGRLRGLEVNFQQPLRFLPGMLSNLGLLLNYTHVTSNIAYVSSTGAILKYADLTGLSRNGANATLYYEDKLISARVSGAYRSGYLTDAIGTQGIDSQGINSTLNIDTSVQLTLTKNVKLTFQGINLTDQYQDQYVDTRNLPLVYHHTGREFLFGVRFNL